MGLLSALIYKISALTQDLLGLSHKSCLLPKDLLFQPNIMSETATSVILTESTRSRRRLLKYKCLDEILKILLIFLARMMI